MLAKKPQMFGVFVEMFGSQHGRNHRHVTVELHAHQAIDDCLANKFMVIDAAIDDETGGHNGGVSAGPCKQLGLQRKLERAGNFE